MDWAERFVTLRSSYFRSRLTHDSFRQHDRRHRRRTGLGRGLAVAFQARGNAPIIVGQRRFAERDASATPGMSHLLLDQDDSASISRFADELRRDHPAINNAGIQRVEDLASGAVGAAEKTVAVDLLGPIRVTAALMPLLLGQARATIINVTSALAFVPLAVAG